MNWIRRISGACLVMGIGATIAYTYNMTGLPANLLGGLTGSASVLCLKYL